MMYSTKIPGKVKNPAEKQHCAVETLMAHISVIEKTSKAYFSALKNRAIV